MRKVKITSDYKKLRAFAIPHNSAIVLAASTIVDIDELDIVKYPELDCAWNLHKDLYTEVK